MRVAPDQVTKGTPKKGDSSGGPVHSSCSGVSKETKKPGEAVRAAPSEPSTTYRRISPLSRWGRPESMEHYYGARVTSEEANGPKHGRRVGSNHAHIEEAHVAPTMAPGKWGRRRSGRCTVQAVRCGRLSWAGICVVVVVAGIPQATSGGFSSYVCNAHQR